MRILPILLAITAVSTAAAKERPFWPGPPAEHDLAVVSIDSPATYHVAPGAPFTPAITVRNSGMDPEAVFTLFFMVTDSGGSTVSYDSLAVADTLFPDSVRQSFFPSPFAPQPAMEYVATAWVALALDGYPRDDTLGKPFSTFQYHDLSVAAIDTPASFMVAPGVFLTPAATIHNGGTFGESGFFAHYLITVGTMSIAYHDSVAVPALDASADTMLVFTPFAPESLTAYTARSFTALSTDSFPANDTARLEFRTFEYAGSVFGHVSDANAGNAPLANAVVTAVSGGASYYDSTGPSGDYLFPSLPDGAYDLSAGKPGYVDSTVHGVVLTPGANLALDFSLGYPAVTLTPADTVAAMLSPGSADSLHWLILENTGTRGALCELTWPERASKAAGDSVWWLDVESKTSDNLCLGVEFDGKNLWVTGAAGSPSADPNFLYKLGRNGNLLASYPQPAGNGWGWRDLCWDGQYLYASSDSLITQIDTATGDTTGLRIQGPISPCRGLAYDPASDHFFVANFDDSIYEINRGGAVLHAWANAKSVFGLAWDATAPDGPWLWAASDSFDYGTMSSHLFIDQFDPRGGVYTGQRFRLNTIDSANAAAGGLAFSASFIHGRGTLIALIQDDRDRLMAYDVRPENARWLSLSSTSLALSPSQRDSVRLMFNNSGLDSLKNYAAWVRVSSTAPCRVDSVLAMLRSPYGVSGGPASTVSGRFALLPCRPNPARGQTVITFSLLRTGRAELAIYNVAGQKVRTLACGNTPAGWHSAIWNGRDDRGQRVSSGIYLCRLATPDDQRVNKVTILR